MNNQDNWVIVGRFGRPHGVKGFVTVQSFTEPRENILRYAHWHVFVDKQWQPIHILSVEVHNKSIIAKIEGYPERESVAMLTNIDVAVPKGQLALLKAGEYYWHDLIGMNVVNQQGQPFGVVTEVMPTGSNDVLIVQGDTRHLIPYLPGECIIDICASKRLITVDWDLDF